MTADDLSILVLTVRFAAIATLLIVPFGIGAAWLLSRRSGAAVTLAETLLSLPLVLPPTAVGLLLLEALRKSGPLGRVLDRVGIEVLFTGKAVVVATAVMAFPLLVRPVRTAFEELDPRLLALGRTLGVGPLGVFLRIGLPLSWRGIAAGVLLAFSRALGEFGATIMIAGSIPGRTQTMALAIFQRSQIGQDGAALRLVAATTVLAFGAILTTEVLGRRRARRLSG